MKLNVVRVEYGEIGLFDENLRSLVIKINKKDRLVNLPVGCHTFGFYVEHASGLENNFRL